MAPEKPHKEANPTTFFKPTIKQEIAKRSLQLLLEQQILSWNIESQKYSDIDVYVATWIQADELVDKTYLKWCDIDSINYSNTTSREWDVFLELISVHGYLCNVYELQIIRNYMEGALLFTKSPELFSSLRTLKRLSKSLESITNNLSWIDGLYEHCFEFIKNSKNNSELRKQVELSLKTGLALKKYFYSERFSSHLSAILCATKLLPKKKYYGKLVTSIIDSVDTLNNIDKEDNGFSLMENPENDYILNGEVVLKEFPWQQQENVYPNMGLSTLEIDKRNLQSMQSKQAVAAHTVLEGLKAKYTLTQLQALLAE